MNVSTSDGCVECVQIWFGCLLFWPFEGDTLVVGLVAVDFCLFPVGDMGSALPCTAISCAPEDNLRILRGISGTLNIGSLADLDVVCLVLSLPDALSDAASSPLLIFRFLDVLDDDRVCTPCVSEEFGQ